MVSLVLATVMTSVSFENPVLPDSSPTRVRTPLAVDLQDGFFDVATPVWADGYDRPNDALRFEVPFAAKRGERLSVTLTGSTVYRVLLNGRFAGYGPARGPKGRFRVDVFDLAPHVRDGDNLLTIEVSAYGVPTFYYPLSPAFLQAEVKRGGCVVAATGWDGFRAFETERVRRTSRYSAQRGFSEAYRVGAACAAVRISPRPRRPLLPRKVGIPSFATAPLEPFARTTFLYDPDAKARPIRFVDEAGGRYGGYPPQELDVNVYAEIGKIGGFSATPTNCSSFALRPGTGVMVRNRINDTGFVGLTVRAEKGTRLVAAFDEIVDGGNGIDPTRCTVGNAVVWDFEADGERTLECFEPVTFKYAHLYVTSGSAEVSDVGFRSYKCAQAVRGRLASDDPELVRIHDAARETFAQNAVDVFSDCPSRERAGWLCDSFWTARASRYFTGSLAAEEVFLENYALADGFDVPDGMVPMCYPADHTSGRFIPNWAMWLVLQVADYEKRGGDRQLVERLKPRLLALKAFLDAYRNADGLLEKLPSWVFIEWSQANRLVQDVNYPSNMLWAKALDALSDLYERPDFAVEARRIRETVRRQCWTGEWFCDNAVRSSDGALRLSGECTETCQYYAFFTGTARPGTHAELWRRLTEEFGPRRKERRLYPEIWPANAFIGNFLRLELLSEAGLGDQVLREVKGYFLNMAERTGTLWEHDSPKASCCHGFASYVGVLLSHCLNGN